MTDQAIPPQTLKSASPARLRALSDAEVALIASDLQSLVGSQLQSCLQTPSEFGLGFYHAQNIFWLWFDLQPLCPVVIRFRDEPPQRKKFVRPLTLFLRARFLGRRLESVRADKSRGRVLIFAFHRAKDESEQLPCEIEVRLFPHGQNIIARDGGKSISEEKPKELPTHSVSVSDSNSKRREEPRPWTEIEEAWRAIGKQVRDKEKRSEQSVTDSAHLERDWQKALEKKRGALKRMAEELEEKSSQLPSEIGEWLKTQVTHDGHLSDHRGDLLEMPPEYREWIDLRRPISWNIEECFRLAKANNRKIEGAKARIAKVQKELAELERIGPSAVSRSREKQAKSQRESLFSRADAQGRRHLVGEDLEVAIGKSAADNMALLRKAQPFDYWLHLREQPGSHGFIRRARGRVVSDQEFIEAGLWVVEQSTGKRRTELKGSAFDLLIVECRYVRPIRGDSLGRVHYSNDRVLRIRL